MAARVVIVGAGVIGLATAYYCVRRGLEVTVIDRSPEARDGCSFGNAGMIVPSHFIPLAAPGMVALGLRWMWNPESPFYIKPRLDAELIGWAWKFWRAANPRHVAKSAPLLRDLSLASRACFEELAALPGADFGLVQRGLLMLCRTQHALDDEAKVAEQARALGIPAQVCDARETAALDSTVTMSVSGSVYFPKDCHLSPARFVAALKSELDRTGVRFLWETGVSGFDVRDARVAALRTDRGAIEGDEFVICGGAWSPLIARALRLTLPMQAGKGYSLTLPNPRQLPRLCSICTEARIAVTPMDGALRFGGTMEIAGLDERINERRVRGIIRSVPDYFPAFSAADFHGVQPWRGLRPCSPDGLPFIGRTARHRNVSIATGHGMMGLSLAPVTGQIIAGQLAGERPHYDLAPLSPDRWA